ncbi:MAG: tyrosine-type recombinase/integrase [Gammaproteobacteria bacterium]
MDDPGRRLKNHLAHRVPLSLLARELLHDMPRLDDRFLFSSPTGSKPTGDTSVDHAVRRNLDAFGVGRFTPHDLRRTAASHMTSMGIPRLVVSKILNHAETGVTAVYDRHSYDAEKRQALDTWGQKLEGIVGGGARN